MKMGVGAVLEGKDYDVGSWKNLPNYQCRLCRGFSTLDLSEMLEHGRLSHRPPELAIGGEMTERPLIYGPRGDPL